MIINLKGFDKYNPRKDLKSMPWFRMENNFYDLEDFYDTDIYTRWLFVFLLCQCAQKVSGTINLDKKYLVFKSGLNESQFSNALNTLLDKSVISLETNDNERTRSDSCLTNEHNGQNEQDGAVAHDLVSNKNNINYTHDDIIQLWNDLAGKKQGYFKGNRLIATREENEELQKIMDIYPEISSWENAIKNILNSDTTNGKAINWKATLPWLCEYKNFKKYANASTIEVKSYEVPDELLKPEFQQLR